MAYLSRKTRFAGLRLGLVLAILFACVEGDLRTCMASSLAISLHQDQGWVVSVPTPLI